MQLNRCEIKTKIYKSKIRKVISAIFPAPKGETLPVDWENFENFLIQLINYSKIVLKINVLTADLQRLDSL